MFILNILARQDTAQDSTTKGVIARGNNARTARSSQDDWWQCFYGNVYTGGLFVDNLKLQTIEDASSIMQLSPKDVINIGVEGKNIVSFSSTKDLNVEIYSINGLIIKQIHLNANELSNIFLPSGMYIIRWPGHFHKIGIQ